MGERYVDVGKVRSRSGAPRTGARTPGSPSPFAEGLRRRRQQRPTVPPRLESINYPRNASGSMPRAPTSATYTDPAAGSTSSGRFSREVVM